MLFLSQAGYHIIFSIRQFEIKEEVKQQLLASLPETALDIIDAESNKEDIDWKEEGREFYLYDQMYDVAFTKNVNGRILIYCLNDKREEKLLKKLNKLLSGDSNKPGSNHPGQELSRFQSPDFILLNESASLPQKPLKQNYFYRTERLISVITESITPPPDQKSKNQKEIL